MQQLFRSLKTFCRFIDSRDFFSSPQKSSKETKNTKKFQRRKKENKKVFEVHFWTTLYVLRLSLYSCDKFSCGGDPLTFLVGCEGVEEKRAFMTLRAKCIFSMSKMKKKIFFFLLPPFSHFHHGKSVSGRSNIIIFTLSLSQRAMPKIIKRLVEK